MTRLSAFGRLFRFRLKNYFLTGLLVVVPLGLTYLVVRWIVTLMDRMLGNLLPAAWHPDQLLGVPLPGLGLIATLLLILLIGLLTANIFGRKLVNFYERMVNKIPLVKGIYGLFKQVADTMLNRERGAFRKVVLLEYPRLGIWSVAFVTGISTGEVQEITDQKLVNLFVPTTPNPTSGFYLLVPEKDLIELTMTVEEAFKLIISGGMVTPPDRRRVRNAGQLEGGSKG